MEIVLKNAECVKKKYHLKLKKGEIQMACVI
jgi:hypothetical protein